MPNDFTEADAARASQLGAVFAVLHVNAKMGVEDALRAFPELKGESDLNLQTYRDLLVDRLSEALVFKALKIVDPELFGALVAGKGGK